MAYTVQTMAQATEALSQANAQIELVRAEADKANAALERMKSAGRHAQQKLVENKTELIGQGVAGLAAWSLGYANGRFGNPVTRELSYFGVPVDAGVGIAAGLASLYVRDPEQKKIAFALSVTGLGMFLSRVGERTGAHGRTDGGAGIAQLAGAAVPARLGAPATAPAWNAQGQTYTVSDHTK